MDNYKKMMDTEHREEIEALTNEWTNERKVSKIAYSSQIVFFLVFYLFICFDFSFYFTYLQQNAYLETAECKNNEVLF